MLQCRFIGASLLVLNVACFLQGSCQTVDTYTTKDAELLPCTIKDQTPTVIWAEIVVGDSITVLTYQSGNPPSIIISTEEKYNNFNYTLEPTSFNLVILNVEDEDGGVYECSPFGSNPTTYDVTVEVLAEPTVRYESLDVDVLDVIVGTSYDLTCSATKPRSVSDLRFMWDPSLVVKTPLIITSNGDYKDYSITSTYTAVKGKSSITCQLTGYVMQDEINDQRMKLISHTMSLNVRYAPVCSMTILGEEDCRMVTLTCECNAVPAVVTQYSFFNKSDTIHVGTSNTVTVSVAYGTSSSFSCSATNAIGHGDKSDGKAHYCDADDMDFMCENPQYLPVGKPGLIHCDIESINYGSIFWSTSSNGSESSCAYIENGVVRGKRYASGDVYLYTNGTLKIYNVTTSDDGLYYLTLINGTGSIMRAQIEVITIVKSELSHPLIDHCGQNAYCMKSIKGSASVSCSFRKARPAVNLEWFTWMSGQPRKINTTQIIIKDGPGVFRTRAELQIENSTTLFHILSCQAFGPSVSPASLTSWVAVYNKLRARDYDDMTITTRSVSQHASTNLPCRESSTDIPDIVLWLSGTTFSDIKPIAYTFSNSLQQRRLSEASHLFDSSTGSIELRDVTHRDHGTLFVCFSSTNFTERAFAFSIAVLVTPSPPYITIEGCANDGNLCTRSERNGSVICKVANVFPMIQLLGTTEEPEKLRITNSEETYESYGNTFVITLVMHYEAVDDCIDGVKMVCSAHGEAAMTFRSSREISILDRNKLCSRPGHPLVNHGQKVTLFIVAGAFIAGLVIYIKKARCCHQQKEKKNKKEEEKMIEDTGKSKEHNEVRKGNKKNER